MTSDMTNGRDANAMRLVASDLLEQAGDTALADLLRQLASGSAEVKVWRVEGDSGEYDDYKDWVVQSYLTEAEAKDHASKLNEWLTANGVHRDQHEHGTSYENSLPTPADRRYELEEECPLDAHLRIDYTGTRYRVVAGTLKLGA